MLILLNVSLLTLMAFLSERVVVEVHGFKTEQHFGVKAKGNQDKFLRYTGYLNSIAKPYKAIYS